MPRQSTADRAVIRPEGGFDRLRPPKDLGKEESAVWREIVLTCDSKHFQASDAPLLVRYCQAAVLSQQAVAALDREGAIVAGRPNPWINILEKCDKAMVALSAHSDEGGH
jgi:phage terminase small subunit